MAQIIENLASRNPFSDETYTPFYAVEPILEYLPKDKIYWLPFDEKWSAFSVRLQEEGYKVILSHINEGKDFFEYEPEEWDIIISNPPFSIKDKVIERVYEFGKPFALLLPVKAIQGKKRFKSFKQGLQLLAFDGRVDYHNRQNMQTVTKGNHFGSMYFCRDLLPRELIFKELIKFERPLIGE